MYVIGHSSLIFSSTKCKHAGVHGVCATESCASLNDANLSLWRFIERRFLDPSEETEVERSAAIGSEASKVTPIACTLFQHPFFPEAFEVRSLLN